MFFDIVEIVLPVFSGHHSWLVFTPYPHDRRGISRSGLIG